MKIGVTGHQDIGSNDVVEWVNSQIDSYISRMNIEKGFTSLAVGADQIFAKVLKQHKIPFTVIIPSNQYEQTFKNSEDLDNYRYLLNGANDTIKLPFERPSESAFYEAGKKIVDLSDVMIAVWNGQPAKGLGGTGDIVKYALSISRRILHINPVNGTVHSI